MRHAPFLNPLPLTHTYPSTPKPQTASPTRCAPPPPPPQAKYLAQCTKKTEEDIIADFQRPRYFTPYEAAKYGLIDTVLEPREEKGVAYEGWDALHSQISELGLWEDDEQPLPTNVMYPGTSEYWRSDFDG